MYEYRANVIRVIDGDTIECLVELGFYVSTKRRFRLLFIDAPETRGEEEIQGKISKEYLSKRLSGKSIVLKSYKSDEEIKSDAFGRWLAVVYLEESTTLIDINSEMVKLGYAVPYER